MLCAEVIHLKGGNDLTILITDIEVLLFQIKAHCQGLTFVRQTSIDILVKEIKGAIVIHLTHKVYLTKVLMHSVQLKSLATIGSAVAPQLGIDFFSALSAQAPHLILLSLEYGYLIQLLLQVLSSGAFFHLCPAAGGGLHAFYCGIVTRSAGAAPHHFYTQANEPKGQRRHTHALRVTQRSTIVCFDAVGQAPLCKGFCQGRLQSGGFYLIDLKVGEKPRP